MHMEEAFLVHNVNIKSFTAFLLDVAFIHSVSEVFPLPILCGGDFTGTADLPEMIPYLLGSLNSKQQI